MAKRFFKHKLLLDEHMDDRHAYPMLNERFDVKHIAADLRAGGLPDPQVYALAATTSRILITRNSKDFHALVRTKRDAGIIDIPPHTPARVLDTTLTALLVHHGPTYFQGRIIPLGIRGGENV